MLFFGHTRQAREIDIGQQVLGPIVFPFYLFETRNGQTHLHRAPLCGIQIQVSQPEIRLFLAPVGRTLQLIQRLKIISLGTLLSASQCHTSGQQCFRVVLIGRPLQPLLCFGRVKPR